MKTLLPILLISIIASTAAANYVTLIEPHAAVVYSNQSIALGKVGPGQTFYVTISANATNNTGALFTRGWNKVVVTGLPPGWIAENSSLYNQELSVKVTASPLAQNGTYAFNLTAINLGNYSKLGTVRFTVQINVTPDVFRLGVTPTNISTGPGQPENIYVTINNTGVSDSPFIISVNNLPGWNTTQTVIALHNTRETFTYPVYVNEPGVYTAQLNVSSASSSLVSKRVGVSLTVAASVLNDYKALGQGSIAFPVIYEPVYAIMSFISSLFNG